jgi:hypothetical protein
MANVKIGLDGPTGPTPATTVKVQALIGDSPPVGPDCLRILSNPALLGGLAE